MRSPLIILLLCVTVAAGCSGWPRRHDELAELSPEQRRLANTMLANSFSDDSGKQGLILQHTMFPYHFVANTAQLNELGERDLQVLAGYYKEHPGQLSIRRGDASEELYARRVTAIVEFVHNEGLDRESIRINDALPGGDGMESERVLSILTKENEQGSNYGSVQVEAGSRTGARR